ncbi:MULTISPECIES: AEC family transporter [unclassified Herbaspirillum]|uniref:AEC family transporter n=1 Tax=unclassified Herbaspirillum TaxID=2624150 RepID=UPI000E2EB44C|nr:MULTISPECIES: AEC family transporter [unclassified Herbaspirillum]RFB65818.1 AEC family transporter [Herbaspirillum sp. 3R-3a1]TFI08873.1 AEC family transporter [Herbaspirillum sp. 3R11]TFI15290.1 AEC family transporter [Herbaspirillum sp. 3R-11]TFI27835.1 AEC family transporter [Herbaspirillum sp. 3C11]
MQVISLLLPDFILILMGVIIFRITNWGEAFWAGMEKMVYYLLFPALLFYSTARLQLNLATTGTFVEVGVLALLAGVALTWIGKPFIKAGPMTYESGMQTAFRFNSYIALALASRLAGEKGVGLMALLIGFGVPLCNMAAVHALAHRSGNLGSELVRNPLLIATGSGLLFALCGFTLPEVAGAVLSRLGSASIALGLLMVGAGLRLSGIREDKLMTTYFTAIKLLAVPAVAYVLGRWLELPQLQLQIVVLFCSLPTASSCYILAARMGGNGPMTAFLISLGTLVSAVTIPFWLMLVH